jgi:hypothetical protein
VQNRFVPIFRSPLISQFPPQSQFTDSFVVPLSDGSAIVTLVWRQGAAIGCSIKRVGSDGTIAAWAPAEGYASPVICCANQRDELFGFDYQKPGKVYICRANGEHMGTLPLPFQADALQHPRFAAKDDQLFWIDREDYRKPFVGTVGAKGLSNVSILPGELAEEALRNKFLGRTEIHTRETHYGSDDCLYVIRMEGPRPVLEKYGPQLQPEV